MVCNSLVDELLLLAWLWQLVFSYGAWKRGHARKSLPARSCTCSLRIIPQPRRQVAYRLLTAMLKERDGMRSAFSRDTPGRAAWSGSDLVWNMATEPTSARPRGAEAYHAGQAALQRQATLCWADDKAPL